MQSLTTSTQQAIGNLDVKLCLNFKDDISLKRLPAPIEKLDELFKLARVMCDKNGIPSE